MKLIALIIVLFIERLWDQVARWRAQRFAERGFFRAYRALQGSLGQLAARWLILLVPPLLLWAWVGFDSGGIIGLLVALVVLFLVLAPRHAHDAAEELRKACVEEDRERVLAIRRGLTERTGIDPENVDRRTLAERIVVLGYDEWFAVLFWFVIAGPGGAALYRLTDWLVQAEQGLTDSEVEDRDGATLIEHLRAILGWPAARVYAALLLLVGAFSRGLAAWIDDEQSGNQQGARTHLEAGSMGLVARVGLAALDLEQDDECEGDDVCLADQAGWYRAASAIVLRALVAWLGIVAIVTFAGWIN